MEKNFIKLHSTKDIIIIVSIIIVGILLAVLPIGGATNVTGYILIACGLILIPIIKSGYKDTWMAINMYERSFTLVIM